MTYLRRNSVAVFSWKSSICRPYCLFLLTRSTFYLKPTSKTFSLVLMHQNFRALKFFILSIFSSFNYLTFCWKFSMTSFIVLKYNILSSLNFLSKFSLLFFFLDSSNKSIHYTKYFYSLFYFTFWV